jgi:hypothetical protein
MCVYTHPAAPAPAGQLQEIVDIPHSSGEKKKKDRLTINWAAAIALDFIVDDC